MKLEKYTPHLLILILLFLSFNFYLLIRSSNYFDMMNTSSNEHWHEPHEDVENWDEMVEHMKDHHGEDLHRSAEGDNPAAESHENFHDFGQIPQFGGIVSTTFEIENHGQGMLEIGEISTSCACTTAEVDKKLLDFNEHAELTVTFDPDFHDEPEGKFERQIYVETNDPEVPELTFTIAVDILENE